MHDLAALQANLMDKLNELMGNMENMFADKDATRKKLAALEKAVRLLPLPKFRLVLVEAIT